MSDCNKHPGFVPNPENKFGDQQLTRDYAKTKPELEAVLDRHLETLTFTDFYNDCFVKLADEDKPYEPNLREATQELFTHLQRYVYPYNCGPVTHRALQLVNENKLKSEFKDFKLIMIQNEPPQSPTAHAWIELIQHQNLPAKILEKKFPNIRRLVIDFSGLRVQNSKQSYNHNTYTPFFGSIQKAPDYHRRKYLDTNLVFVSNLKGTGLLSIFLQGEHIQTTNQPKIPDEP